MSSARLSTQALRLLEEGTYADPQADLLHNMAVALEELEERIEKLEAAEEERLSKQYTYRILREIDGEWDWVSATYEEWKNFTGAKKRTRPV